MQLSIVQCPAQAAPAPQKELTWPKMLVVPSVKSAGIRKAVASGSMEAAQITVFFFLSYVHLLNPCLFNPITGKLKYFSLFWMKNVVFDVKCCQSLLFANLKAQLCFLKILLVGSHSQLL